MQKYCRFCKFPFDTTQQINFCSPSCYHAARRARSADPSFFWTKVDKKSPNECWPYKGRRTDRGYGVFQVGTKKKRAHRVAYELTYGMVPPTMSVCHTCDNPPCCNPVHLWLGTPLENMHDCIQKGRAKKSFGEHHHFSVLTEQEVLSIYAQKGKKTSVTLAAEFHVAAGTILSIFHRKTWKHLLSPEE